MEANPLVSVCIPVYNADAYLQDCVASVMDQSYKNIEIIIVDNGSADGSLDLARSFNYPNVTIEVEPSRGASKARNKALTMARGKYIQFLDADDRLSPDKIEEQVKILEAAPGKLALCSTVHFFDGEPLNKFKPSPYEEQFLYDTNDPVAFIINLWGGNNFKGSMIQPNAWLIPRTIITAAGGWNESLTLDDDGEFFSRIILHSGGIRRTGGLNYYRKFKSSANNLASVNNEDSANSAFHAVLLKRRHLFSQDRSESAKKAIYLQLRYLSIRYYRKYPALYKRAEAELGNFDHYHFVPIFGGRVINFIAQHISWKLARILQTIVR
ncbi:MAG: glycosyltransferase family 2 protein [Mucilaginibacter sp.]|nr:glycosyltransferase family 2 protein [Mucilaginibacter sp.]